MRDFTVVHISDLHIGSVPCSRLDVLTAGIKAALAENQMRITDERERLAAWNSPSPLPSVNSPTILVVSGDLVETPTNEFLNEAKQYIEKISEFFSNVFIVPGNHDVNKYVGCFIKSEKFNEILETSPNLIMREVGLHIIGIDSTPASWAKGAVDQVAYDRMVVDAYEGEMLPSQERDGLIRVVVLHHHPLPLVERERRQLFGMLNEEDFLYLQNPATFLSACMECGTSLILHGHRHAEGVRRYSVQSSGQVAIYDDGQWDDIYVLACPSSTGKGKDCDAGFNVIRMSEDVHYIDVTRYYRPGNRGKFMIRDQNRPGGTIRLFLGKQLMRDVAVDVGARIACFPSTGCAEEDLFREIEQLFRRRAFYICPERDWGQLLYAVIRTRLVWEQQVFPRLRARRHKAADGVLRCLLEIENFVADNALEMDQDELSQITQELIGHKDEFLRRLPRVNISHHGQGPRLEVTRQGYLKGLRDYLLELGVSIPDLGDQWTLGGLEE